MELQDVIVIIASDDATTDERHAAINSLQSASDKRFAFLTLGGLAFGVWAESVLNSQIMDWLKEIGIEPKF